MKKLILYDHLGEKQLELDVFVEGQDFSWTPLVPQAVWLGTIMLVDKEPEEVIPTEFTLEQEEVDRTQLVPEPEPIKIPEPELVSDEERERVLAEEAIRRGEGETEEETEELGKEVGKIELETTNNQSVGESGVSEAKQPESTEEVHKKPSRGESTKGGKKPRKPKTT